MVLFPLKMNWIHQHLNRTEGLKHPPSVTHACQNRSRSSLLESVWHGWEVNFEWGWSTPFHTLVSPDALWTITQFDSASVPEGTMKCLQRQPEMSRSQELQRYARSQKVVNMNVKLLGRLHTYLDDLVADVAIWLLGWVSSQWILCCHSVDSVDFMFKALRLCMLAFNQPATAVGLQNHSGLTSTLSCLMTNASQRGSMRGMFKVWANCHGLCKMGCSWAVLWKSSVYPVKRCSLLPCFSGMEGDPDLQFLLQGGDLLKVRSSSWKKTRYYRLQEDCKTMWHESKKTFKTKQTCECCPSTPAACVWDPPTKPLAHICLVLWWIHVSYLSANRCCVLIQLKPSVGFFRSVLLGNLDFAFTDDKSGDWS